jgi:2-haloacid dehalogenase
MQLTDFKVLTFDCYGTLIDWETGILAGLQPLVARVATPPNRDRILDAYARHEAAQEAETPSMRYSDLLATVHGRLAREWGVEDEADEAAAFGASVPDWPAFADTPDALAYLKRHYALVILSNIDRASFAGSSGRLGVEFDAVFTAEEIGSYKPDARNFQFLIDRLAQRGFATTDILHTAQSLYHDHVPARAAGLASAWIDRGHEPGASGATLPPGRPAETLFDFRFGTMGEMAAAHRRLSQGGAVSD